MRLVICRGLDRFLFDSWTVHHPRVESSPQLSYIDMRDSCAAAGWSRARTSGKPEFGSLCQPENIARISPSSRSLHFHTVLLSPTAIPARP